jgi:hypothetical protein
MEALLISRADELRSPSEYCAMDLRNAECRFDVSEARQGTLADHHADVAQFQLPDSVPEGVRIQFETVKNLYLYAWGVYRFYPIAQHQALACLELALRQRFSSGLPKKYSRRADQPPTLKPLLLFAMDTGVIRNEGFRRWHDGVRNRAKARYDSELLHQMIDHGLDVIQVDYANAIPNDADRNWDYMKILLDTLPGIRNSYAHGSMMLHNQVLGAIELVCEIIIQLFSISAGCSAGPNEP